MQLATTIGSFFGKLSGSKEAAEMEEVAIGLKNVSKIAEDIDEDTVLKLSRTMRLFALIAEAIPHADLTFLEFLGGTDKFAEFANNMQQLGYGLRSFNNSVLKNNKKTILYSLFLRNIEKRKN